MKIKYLDDEPFKRKEKKFDPVIVLIKAALTVIISGTIIGTYYLATDPRSAILNYEYVTENNISYSASGLYVLYKEDSVKICYIESEVLDSKINIPMTQLLKNFYYDRDYKFHIKDVVDNSEIATTTKLYRDTSSEEIIVDGETMNGYKIESLSDILLEDNKEKENRRDTSYISNDYINQYVKDYVMKK